MKLIESLPDIIWVNMAVRSEISMKFAASRPNSGQRSVCVLLKLYFIHVLSWSYFSATNEQLEETLPHIMETKRELEVAKRAFFDEMDRLRYELESSHQRQQDLLLFTSNTVHALDNGVKAMQYNVQLVKEGVEEIRSRPSRPLTPEPEVQEAAPEEVMEPKEVIEAPPPVVVEAAPHIPAEDWYKIPLMLLQPILAAPPGPPPPPPTAVAPVVVTSSTSSQDGNSLIHTS